MRSAVNDQEEWLKVLGKGMVTLPKKWRDELGIDSGDVVKAKKEGKRVVIEAQKGSDQAPFRVYSDVEIDEFLKEDKLSKSLSKKVKNLFKKFQEKKLSTSASVLLDLAKAGGHGPKDLSKNHDKYGWE
ncbi:AbrB/MazE/SpoVT family DNA-binding domain-containing protein [Candidatus Roizmanbacteria bacterium]|nr:AbrB/MazE/SpoVT family DNA-binding domain-containing protein [Candidatus Roizmanbacteria bacterium]